MKGNGLRWLGNSRGQIRKIYKKGLQADHILHLLIEGRREKNVLAMKYQTVDTSTQRTLVDTHRKK